MSRVYAIPLDGTITLSGTDTDLFEITPADDKPVRILGLILSQTSELGDAAEEALKISIIRGHTTSGSGGSTPVISPLDPNDVAASFAAEVNNTTIASVGTGAVLDVFGWNIRNSPLERWWPDAEMQPRCTQGQTTIVVRSHSTPADDITFQGTLYVVEE